MTIKLYNEGAGDQEEILERLADPLPAILATKGRLYTKSVLGVTQLFYRASDGTVDQLTPSTGTPSPWNNTTTAGFITENVVTENVLIGTLVATLARKLVILTTNAGVDQGIRVESAAAGDNVLDFLKTGDAFVRLSITGTTIAIGDGTGAPDVALSRILAPLAMLNVNVATRFGGDVSRHEAAWFIQTTRTLPGAGDDVTVKGADAAVIVAGSAFAGAQASVVAGDAAGLTSGAAGGANANVKAGNAISPGPGAINAVGGNVTIQTGLGAFNSVPGAVGTISGHVIVEDKAANGVDVLPPVDQDGSTPFKSGKLGTAGQRWFEIHVASVISGDVVFTDPGCPICGKEFAKGDDIVLRVIDATKSDGGCLTRTVPAHYTCH
jgi:hypothetical protein